MLDPYIGFSKTNGNDKIENAYIDFVSKKSIKAKDFKFPTLNVQGLRNIKKKKTLCRLIKGDQNNLSFSAL